MFEKTHKNKNDGIFSHLSKTGAELRKGNGDIQKVFYFNSHISISERTQPTNYLPNPSENKIRVRSESESNESKLSSQETVFFPIFWESYANH